MGTRQITLAIKGMRSPHCATSMEQALARLDGVIAARANPATECAMVVFDSARVSVVRMVDTVRGQGLDLSLACTEIPFGAALRGVPIANFSRDALVNVSLSWRTGCIRIEWATGTKGSELLTFPTILSQMTNTFINRLA